MTNRFSKQIQSRLLKLQNNLASEFRIELLSKSPARFNQKKLEWFNREFIKMMSLEEFVYRSNTLKLQKKSTIKNLTQTDFVYFVDFINQTVLVENLDKVNPARSSLYQQYKGIRLQKEDQNHGLIKEISEITNGQENLDTTQLQFITSFLILPESIKSEELEQLENPQESSREGEMINIFVYPVSSEHIQPQLLKKDSQTTWVPITDVLSNNQYLTYPIWKEFCIQNNYTFPQPNQQIIQQYLAYKLDKNRITTLSEFGNESDCILNWKPPLQEDLISKKASLEESKSNLIKLKSVIEMIYKNFPYSYPETLEQVDSYLISATSWWDSEIKKWLESEGYEQGIFLWPLRVALSGKKQSPSPFEILSIISLQEAISRINSSTSR